MISDSCCVVGHFLILISYICLLFFDTIEILNFFYLLKKWINLVYNSHS